MTTRNVSKWCLIFLPLPLPLPPTTPPFPHSLSYVFPTSKALSSPATKSSRPSPSSTHAPTTRQEETVSQNRKSPTYSSDLKNTLSRKNKPPHDEQLHPSAGFQTPKARAGNMKKFKKLKPALSKMLASGNEPIQPSCVAEGRERKKTDAVSWYHPRPYPTKVAIYTNPPPSIRKPYS